LMSTGKKGHGSKSATEIEVMKNFLETVISIGKRP